MNVELLTALDPTTIDAAPAFLDVVNDKLEALQATIRGAVVVVAIILFLVVAGRSRLRLAPTVLALVGAASVIWLAAGGGLEWFAGLLGQEFSADAVPHRPQPGEVLAERAPNAGAVSA